MQAHPYYLSHKKSLLRSHRRLMRLGVEIMTTRYTPEYAAQVQQEDFRFKRP